MDTRIYDDFNVTSPGGWKVSSVWSNDYFLSSFFGGPPNVRQAVWSIRSGVSAGNGGTVVAQGSSPVQLTSTGRSPNFLYTEYMVRVNNLSVFLEPGTYWLQVTPLFGGDTFLSVTNGAGAVGTPPGNDKNSFFSQPSTNTFFAPQNQDFSLGVAGTVVPEPSAAAFLLGSVAMGSLWAFRRRKLR